MLDPEPTEKQDPDTKKLFRIHKTSYMHAVIQYCPEKT